MNVVFFLEVLRFIFVVENSSCQNSSAQRFSLHRFERLRRFHLFNFGIFGDFLPWRSNSAFVFFHVVFPRRLHNGDRLFSFRSESSFSFGENFRLEQVFRSFFRSSKFIEILIRVKNSRERPVLYNRIRGDELCWRKVIFKLFWWKINISNLFYRWFVGNFLSLFFSFRKTEEKRFLSARTNDRSISRPVQRDRTRKSFSFER